MIGLEKEVTKIVEKDELPKSLTPLISENEKNLYLHDPKIIYTMQKRGKVLGRIKVREAVVGQEGLIQTKNSK